MLIKEITGREIYGDAIYNLLNVTLLKFSDVNITKNQGSIYSCSQATILIAGWT